MSFADFEVQKEFCTMSNNFLGRTSDGTEYNGVINISFTDGKLVLPLINVSLSRNIDPTEVRLSWPEAKLYDSLQRPLFESDVQERLESEIKQYFELKKEGYAFYSKAYGFYRFQHFMALFLSQNDLLLSFKNKGEQNFETQLVSLAGSDLAFREMTYQCHFEAVRDYLAVDQSRKQPVYKSWTDGYGITNFGEYEILLPVDAKYPNDITKFLNQDSKISYVKLSDIFSLLKQKSNLNDQVDTIQIDEEYISLNEEIKKSSEAAINLSSQKNSLGGDSGLIQKIESDLKEIEIQISTSESSINVYEKRISPLKERLEILKIKISDLKNRLSDFNDQIKETQSKNYSFERDLESLTNLISDLANEYSAQDLENYIPEPLFTPYTIEEIEASYIKVNQKIQERSEINRLLGLVSSIANYIDDLSVNHKKAMDVFNQISEEKIKKVQLKEAYYKNEIAKVQLLDSIGNINFEVLEKSIIKDKKTDQFENLKNSEVRSLLIENIKNSYAEYDSVVEAQKSNRQDLLSHIVCKSDYFLSSFQGQCFDPINSGNFKNIELYIDQLDSPDINNLRFIMDSSNSLIERHNSNLVSKISERLKAELENAPAKNIQNLWIQILYSRWAFYVVRSLVAEEEFSFKALENALRDQRNQIQALDDQKDDISAQIIKIDLKLNNLNSKFINLESEYFESLNKNQNLIVSQINQSKVDTSNSNLSCLLAIRNLDLCLGLVDGLVSASNAKLSDNSESIKDMVIVLIVSARSNIEKIEKNLKESVEKMNILISQKDEYIQVSGYDDKNKVYEAVKGEHLRQVLQLRSLIEQKYRLEAEKTAALIEKQTYTDRFKSLVSQVQNLVSIMKPTLIKLKPKCDKMNVLLKDIENIDRQILNILGISGEPGSTSSLCQIDF